jgi:transcriptional regulator of arginine metabolism
MNNDAMNARDRRQQRILQLLEQGQVGSQEQLQSLLAREGIQAAQATLSRDLRRLGVVKGSSGYVLAPDDVSGQEVGTEALRQAFRAFVTGVEQGGNIVVARTGPGRAQPVAWEIDRARLPQVMGTIAGDDTVFVAARTSAAAGILARQLRQLADLKGESSRPGVLAGVSEAGGVRTVAHEPARAREPMQAQP